MIRASGAKLYGMDHGMSVDEFFEIAQTFTLQEATTFNS